MTYLYEQLDPERFQQFCQALLAVKFPNTQCLPVAQPDGGRDAFTWSLNNAQTSKDGIIVFQIKFSRNPDRPDEDFLNSIIKAEVPKIERLKQRGVKAYYLLTNIRGSARLDVGSIDKVDKALSEAVGIPAYCWWRDDLDRRIDTESDLKWSFPDIIRGNDLLQGLLSGAIGENAERRDNALKAYLASQLEADKEVKFKQVDLYNSLLDLFVDTDLYPVDSEFRVSPYQLTPVPPRHL